MVKNELPTFTRWAEKAAQYRVHLAVMLGLWAAVAAIRVPLRRYLNVALSCEQDCSSDPARCQPIEFSFHVSPAKIRPACGEYLWYRASLKNRSCVEVSGASVAGFLFLEDVSESSGLWLKITGPDGKVVTQAAPKVDGGVAWDFGTANGVVVSTEGAIHPYRPDFERMKSLRKSGHLFGTGITRLQPNEEFTTLEPVLQPYRIVEAIARSSDGGVGHGFRWVDVENPPKFPSPPAGYSVLDRYEFKLPGKYKITARYRDRVSIYPIFHRWKTQPIWMRILSIGLYPGGGVHARTTEVDLTSPTFEFEVVR